MRNKHAATNGTPDPLIAGPGGNLVRLTQVKGTGIAQNKVYIDGMDGYWADSIEVLDDQQRQRLLAELRAYLMAAQDGETYNPSWLRDHDAA